MEKEVPVQEEKSEAAVPNVQEAGVPTELRAEDQKAQDAEVAKVSEATATAETEAPKESEVEKFVCEVLLTEEQKQEFVAQQKKLAERAKRFGLTSVPTITPVHGAPIR